MRLPSFLLSEDDMTVLFELLSLSSNVCGEGMVSPLDSAGLVSWV